MTNQVLYGPFVVSDITHYADLEDLKELLRRRFPMAIGESQPPWTLQVSTLWTLTSKTFEHSVTGRNIVTLRTQGPVCINTTLLLNRLITLATSVSGHLRQLPK